MHPCLCIQILVCVYICIYGETELTEQQFRKRRVKIKSAFLVVNLIYCSVFMVDFIA